MRRKILSVILGVSVVIAGVTACGKSETTDTSGETIETEKEETERPEDPDDAGREDTDEDANGEAEQPTVGLAFPSISSERWIKDADYLKTQLEEKGYYVEAEFAEDDVKTQISQIEELIAQDAECLVIAAVDSSSLTEVLEQAKDKEIPVIAYDNLIMDSDAVTYYAGFEQNSMGVLMADYIVQANNLEGVRSEGESRTIEFFMGSETDSSASVIYEGAMQILQSYLDDGTLKVPSGKTSFEDTSLKDWSQESAKQACQERLTDEKLDIVYTAFDGYTYGIREALEKAGYSLEANWPMITGQGAELMAVKNILAGYQEITLFKDIRQLADGCVTMVDNVIHGKKSEAHYRDVNNNVTDVPSYLVMPQIVSKQNYVQQLIDTGYYAEDELME